MESIFWDNINQGMVYNCDRCEVVELRADEYENNQRRGFRYCDECWCWIHLQNGTDKDGNQFSSRSERKIIA